jgi:iron(III) transport system substrate-binding protein
VQHDVHGVCPHHRHAHQHGLKGSGEALAQLIAEKDNPKTDVWFGGTGDPHLQAAEQGLTLEYKSPTLPQLHDWAQQQAKQSGYKTVGIYSGPLGFGYNPELLAKKKLPVPKTWADLLKPEYKGEVQVANPASSGTAYTMIATLVQLMGEDKAFEYLKALHRNVGLSAFGHRPHQGGGARRDRGVHQLRARRPRREDAGLPGRDHHAERRHRRRDRLHEHHQGRAQPRRRQEVLRMGADARRAGMAAAAKQFQLPSNKAAKVDPRVPDFKKIKFINYDYAKYGASAERRRLIARWEKEVNSLPR